jgi:hypothetical protein
MMWGMGKTNRLASNERKMRALLGERRDLENRILKAEKLVGEIDKMKARLEEIEQRIESGIRWIQDDHPGWTPDHLDPQKPFVHHNLIKFGNGTKLTLAILREAFEPMTVRDIAVEAIRREGHETFTDEELDTAANTINAGLKRQLQLGAPIAHDNQYPRRWFSLIENGDDL